MARAKVVTLEAAQTLSETAREGLLAYAMTGSVVASIAIVAAPHFDLLLRCIFDTGIGLAAPRWPPRLTLLSAMHRIEVPSAPESPRRPEMQRPDPHTAVRRDLPSQIVLVLQGGGALGSYQAGVYQALQEAGIEPDWSIGTSIGAINASLIAGSQPQRRLERLHAFWSRVERAPDWFFQGAFPGLHGRWSNWSTMTRGIPGFFAEPACPCRGRLSAGCRSRRLLLNGAACADPCRTG